MLAGLNQLEQNRHNLRQAGLAILARTAQEDTRRNTEGNHGLIGRVLPQRTTPDP